MHFYTCNVLRYRLTNYVRGRVKAILYPLHTITIGTRNKLALGQENYLLTALEEQNCNLPKVKVDEVLRLVRHVRAKVPAHNGVPSRVVSNVLLMSKVKFVCER